MPRNNKIIILLYFNNFSKHLQSLLDYCKTGEDEGATLVYGGKRIDRQGKNHFFVHPSLSFQLSILSHLLSVRDVRKEQVV